ncbi:hypothetical protein KAFR_0E02920 [Kazachstania africana CBS 2517]|uniref:GID complex catalytic subunit 2 n=1 Tax=Kazachstania africana (strain ATCC 22294 / BCRC 22015 / CBS 2517 / CECT 1963 / NBRC 1671 / NRRL Y-8276) TaxID=1071382 RepID=H2AVP4_KAZAF|nr:hypothetical protein KAFR_0E02920 [Kazachstania africana CBS 2517]CCF58444.1 hypothetical protein KAFR_0E02920 [Kazachstania africana CBS 2517]
MSKLLETLDSEFNKLYSSDASEETPLKLYLKETHEFKVHLKKLKAHLNKHIEESELQIKGNGDVDKLNSNRMDKKHALIVEKLNRSHKNWNNSIKKHKKLAKQHYDGFNKNALVKLKKFDIDDVYVNKLPENSQKYINQAIGLHIARYNISMLPVQEKSDVLKYLQDVYGLDKRIAEHFIIMGQIVESLKSGKLDSCPEWCNMQKEKSASKSPTISILEYEIYVLKGLQMIKENSVLDVCKYLITAIPANTLNEKEIKNGKHVAELLTRLMLGEKIENIDELIKEKTDLCIKLFTDEYCLKNQLPFDSPLFLIVLSGLISFQFFIKYNQIRAYSHVGWTTQDELPFDVSLPEFLSRFHPIFICPVLKEETTRDNPPYSLACHHVISKKALDRLSKNGSLSFKCPYCPVHTSMAKTKKVKFIMV